jgi:hypothetical protein
LGIRLGILLLWLAAAALLPATAGAASLSYIGSDGNAYIATPDGSRTVQLTRDASADVTYRMAGQTDSGTVVVSRRTGGDTWYHWLNRDGSNKSGPWLAPEGNIGTGPLKSHVAPEGGFVVFYASNCTFACGSQFFRVVFMPEGPLASECTINCHDGYLFPRWIPGTPYAGMVDSGLGTVYVQSQSGLQEWFSYGSDFDIGHFDVSRDRGFIMTEDTPSTASSPGALTLLKANGLPPGNQPVEVLCEVPGFSADANASPVWSPDGTQIAWSAADGIHVSGAPVDQGSNCSLPGDRLVIPGGKQVEWGTQDAPTPTVCCGPAGRPVVTFGVAGRLPSLLRALRNGIVFRVRTNRAGRALVNLLASGVFARGVSVSATKVVGRGSRRLPRAGTYRVVARFTRKAKRRYRRLRRVRLTARVTVRAAGGGATTKRRRITLRR